ncbi:ExbD/TolR family protein [Adhaeribacter rhizoryzae]|uniref:Biopolymer transporter ExbD n=1 Tax=Adhaeribacter rhizoryzae TaxID=2607907 RepID=A0A5M6D006_9BACT|nr:biopolymer transporter ExbD [Adhaeribacter rhizoryzae]KAA5540808.1 biopolymer transporter ExbD [Adhaeribacter rhizoryzae]
MNFRKTKKRHASVEAASLSDILFFLLLFFLIISTLASPTAIKLLLPKAQHTQSIPKNLINLSVNSQLEYFIEKNQLSFTDLNAALESLALNTVKPTIVLRIDRTVQVDELIKVVDIINKNHLPMVVATTKAQ